MKTKYMHTIDEKPAFMQGGQIVFACMTSRIRLADSLSQIRKEQRASDAWRTKKGFDTNSARYGYKKIAL